MAEANEVITINFKTTKGTKESIQISKSATVQQLKEKIQEKSSELEAERQRVIYKGRVLKNDKTVAESGLEEGQMVIVVIKKKKDAKAKTVAPTANTSASTTQATTAPSPSVTTAPNPSTNANANANPGAQANANPFAMPGMGMGGMGGMPGMMQNPAMMQQMLSNPMVQQMMQQMAQNPAMLQQMMQSNPMLQQMVQNNPQAQAMLSNPEMLRQMMNPQVMQAAMQMQQAMQAMQQAQQSARSAAPNTGATDSNTSTGATGATGTNATAPPNPQANPFAAMFGGMPPGGVNGANGANPFANFMMPPMGNMNQQVAAPPQQDLTNARITYASQMNQLTTMGFTDADANIQALILTGGNVQAAIDRLLSGGTQ